MGERHLVSRYLYGVAFFVFQVLCDDDRVHMASNCVLTMPLATAVRAAVATDDGALRVGGRGQHQRDARGPGRRSGGQQRR